MWKNKHFCGHKTQHRINKKRLIKIAYFPKYIVNNRGLSGGRGERMNASVSKVSPISARIQSIKIHGHGFHVKLMDLAGRKELIASKRIAWGNCRALCVCHPI